MHWVLSPLIGLYSPALIRHEYVIIYIFNLPLVNFNFSEVKHWDWIIIIIASKRASQLDNRGQRGKSFSFLTLRWLNIRSDGPPKSKHEIGSVFFSANKYDVQYVGGVGLCMKTLTRLCYKNVFLSVPAEWIGQVPTTFLCVIFSERLRVNVEVFQWKFCFDQSESCQSGQFCQFRLICMHCRVWLGGGGWFTNTY